MPFEAVLTRCKGGVDAGATVFTFRGFPVGVGHSVELAVVVPLTLDILSARVFRPVALLREIFYMCLLRRVRLDTEMTWMVRIGGSPAHRLSNVSLRLFIVCIQITAPGVRQHIDVRKTLVSRAFRGRANPLQRRRGCRCHRIYVQGVSGGRWT